MKIKSAINYIKLELKDFYEPREAQNIAFLLLEHVLNDSKMNIQLNIENSIGCEEFSEIQNALTELKKNKPIQHLLGMADFYDLQFKVNRHVLIPRSETEELLQLIINENKRKNLQVLDIGTGSACIAIVLAKHLRNAKICGLDVSEKALKLAMENVALHHAEVQLYCKDILHWERFKWASYDIIVSNPPYVTEAEKDKMANHVLCFEPHVALFVSNHDPLLFYRRILEFACVYLKKDGRIYFEINENLGKPMKKLFQGKPFAEVMLRKDIHGKNRMISAIKTN